MSSTTQAIFTPIKVGNNRFRHRVVLATLTRFRATVEGNPTDLQVEYYKQRATDGGLLITEATGIAPGTAYSGAPQVCTKDQIVGWKKITSAVHTINRSIK